MDERAASISRREALKSTAKIAGVAAFAAPVVVGVFSAPAVRANHSLCGPATDSDSVPATITSGGDWNTNCGGNCDPSGRYNGQNSNFTIVGASGSVQVGSGGVDNFCAAASFYLITNPAGYVCDATFTVEGCTGAVINSTPGGGAPMNAIPLPYCSTNCAGVKLVLASVNCCPTA